MKLKTIKLYNFRGIEKVEIPFNGKTTILFGINGVGKSTILRAIDLIYANIIAQLTNSNKKLAQLEFDDISYGKSYARIEAEYIFEDGSEDEYWRAIYRLKAR
jgi:predicted ATP-binding protein involved in virulence